MNKKLTFFNTMWITLIITSFLLSIIFDIFLILVIAFILLFLIRIAIYKLEVRKLYKSSMKYKNDDYNGMIEYLKKSLTKVWLNETKNWCYSQLVTLYMLNDEAIKAKYLLEYHPKIKNNKNLYYIQLILGYAEQNKQKVVYYSNLVLNLKKEKVKLQQEATKMMLEMLRTKTFNEELYELTEYPLLKRICLKYQDKTIELDDLTIKYVPTNITGFTKPKGILHTVKILLNVLSIASIWISLIIIAMISGNNSSGSMIEQSYLMTKNMWIFYLFLPITIGNIIYGVFLKCKQLKYVSSIVIGSIMSFLLIIFGSISNQTTDLPSIDPAYVEEFNVLIDLPTDYTIIASEENYILSDNGEVYYVQTLIQVNDENYKYIFDKTNWMKTLPTLKSVPYQFLVNIYECEYFMVYCVDTKEFNPEYTYNDNEYSYITFAYDEDNNTIYIMNYYQIYVIGE